MRQRLPVLVSEGHQVVQRRAVDGVFDVRLGDAEFALSFQ